METDYSFFEQSMAEKRSYRVTEMYNLGGLLEPPALLQIEIISRRKSDFRFRGSHVMRPGNPIGLARVNERFDITLPQDIDEFYRRWDGGLLVFRQCYPLLSVDAIIKHSEFVRDARKGQEPDDLPWHLIRFCDMGNGNYLALRLREDGTDWELLYTTIEYLDVNMLRNRKEHWGLEMDASFRDWLKRMCQTDGWPEGSRHDPPDDKPPAERLD